MYGALPRPTRDNCTFDGWYTLPEGGVKITSDTEIETAEDMIFTLYAHWIIGAYEVKFDPNGGSVSEETRSVNYGSAIGALPTPTKTGYVFEGWYTSDNIKVTSESILDPEGDIALTAKWKLAEYTLSFANGAYYSVSVKRTSSPNAGASVGTLSSGAKIYYGDVLSVTYTAATHYKITNKGATSITVTGNVDSSKIYATAAFNGVLLTSKRGSADQYNTPGKIEYYIEIYDVGGQLYLKGWAYDTWTSGASLRIDVNSTDTFMANLSGYGCPIEGDHGFEYTMNATSRLMITVFPAAGTGVGIFDQSVM